MNFLAVRYGKTKRPRFLPELAKALNCELSWLLEGDNKQTHASEIPPQDEWHSVSEWDNDTPLNADEVEIRYFKSIELAAGDGCCTNEGQTFVDNDKLSSKTP